MKLTIKKTISLMITLCLMVIMLPATAFADGAGGLTGTETTLDVSKLGNSNIGTENVGAWFYDATEKKVIIYEGDAANTFTLTGTTSSLKEIVKSSNTTIVNLVFDQVDLTIKRIYSYSGDITINHGDIIFTEDAFSLGIVTESGYIIIDNSTVNVTSADNGINAGNGSNPGNVIITNSEVQVTNAKGPGIKANSKITITESSVLATGDFNGAFCNDDVKIHNSSVVFTALKNDSDAKALYSNGKIEISGGSVTGVSQGYGIYSSINKVTIKGGNINATMNFSPTNGAADSPITLHKAKLLLPEAGVFATVSGTVSSYQGYNFTKTKTDKDGILYLWLPAGEATVILTGGTTSYNGTFTVKDDNSTVWPSVSRRVTFDPKGGTLDPLFMDTDEATNTLSSLPTPTWADHVFKGWYSAYYGGEQVSTDTVFMLDKTVYARWTKNDVLTDAHKIDLSKLVDDYSIVNYWSYSADSKTLTVTENSKKNVTLTGVGIPGLTINVTGADSKLTLDQATIPGQLNFSESSSAQTILEIPAGSNVTSGAIHSERSLEITGSGSLTVSTTGYDGFLLDKGSLLKINGANVSFTGDRSGVLLNNGSDISVVSGSLTVGKSNDNYDNTIIGDGASTIEVSSGASLTVNDGNTNSNITINNNGGTVLINGDVDGTANNISGSFEVTGTVGTATGVITQPVLPDISIDLGDLQSSTEDYEVVKGNTLSVVLENDSQGDLVAEVLSRDKVIHIKRAGNITLTGQAPVGYLLLDTFKGSKYTLNGVSIDGLHFYTSAVVINGDNKIGSYGIPYAGKGANGTATYSGNGNLAITHNGSVNQLDGAFPFDECGTVIIDGCTVQVSGFNDASVQVEVRSGSFTADGRVEDLVMKGGTVEIYLPDDEPTFVTYTGGKLALHGPANDGDFKIGFYDDAVENTSIYLWGYSTSDPYMLKHNSLPTPTKNDYIFEGWYAEPGLSTKIITDLSVSENKNLYAKWSPIAITITEQPQGKTLTYGYSASASLSVMASSNTSAVAYHWYSNTTNSTVGGSPILGATESNYTIPKGLGAGSHYYYCVVAATGYTDKATQVSPVTIEKRPVTVKADNKSMDTGSTIPTLTYTVEGQLTGEISLVGTPALACMADGKTVGNYPITVDLSGVTYTDNYTAATPAYLSGILNVLNAVTPPSGGGSSTPPPTVVAPAGPTTVTTTVGSDGTASAEVTSAQATEALKAAQAAVEGTNQAPKVEIKLNAPAGTTAVEAKFSAASVQAMASGGVGGLTLASDVASITFDAGALGTLSGAGSGDVSISAAQVDASKLSPAVQSLLGGRPVFEFTVTSGDQTISKFDGTVTVSVPYTLASGENPNAVIISYINASGNLEIVANGCYDAATGTVVFSTNHFSQYTVGHNSIHFNDVSGTAWYADAVTFLAARDITGGTTVTTFSPDATLTRGQFVTMLLRAYGLEPGDASFANFADAGNTYYTGYLAAAKQLGITSGTGDNLFSPENDITRQQMVTLLYNALKVIKAQPMSTSVKKLSSFKDSGSIAAYAQEGMAALVEAGAINGNNGYLLPDSTTTRAQMAQVLYRLMKK